MEQINQEDVKKEQKDVVLVDIYNIIYRAFYGNMSNLKNSEGLPTGALFTTIKMLQKIPKQFTNLEYVLAVFDGGGTNFRKDLDPDYKSTRKEMPEDLKIQMPYIKEALKLLGWPMYVAQDVEADDVVSTLAVRAASKGFKVYIMSGDKDFRQIVNENINIIDTMYDVCYDRAKVIEKMGVPPEQIRDYLTLCGDSADNVKGVAKAGPKTVVKWLAQYGDIDNLIVHKDDIKGVVGDNLRTVIDSGELLKWRTLVTVKLDVDIQLTRGEMRFSPIDEDGWKIFCEKMNFKSLLPQAKKL